MVLAEPPINIEISSCSFCDGTNCPRHAGAFSYRGAGLGDWCPDRPRGTSPLIRSRLALPARGRCADQDFSSFSRFRSSFDARNAIACFASTSTPSPVRGLRAQRGLRCFVLNAPKPRNSTRSPRLSASVISPNTVSTKAITSRCDKCGFSSQSLVINSDLTMCALSI